MATITSSGETSISQEIIPSCIKVPVDQVAEFFELPHILAQIWNLVPEISAKSAGPKLNAKLMV
jgi:hypothetical protein